MNNKEKMEVINFYYWEALEMDNEDVLERIKILEDDHKFFEARGLKAPIKDILKLKGYKTARMKQLFKNK